MRERTNSSARGLDISQNRSDVLCAAFSHASALGFAIFDDQLRYRAVNQALVMINGLSATAHLGNTIRDVLGNPVANQIEPCMERVIATRKPAVLEISATLLTRSAPGSWILHYFVVNGAAGTAIGNAVVAVEVTEQRKLDRFVSQLTGDLLRNETRENCFWRANYTAQSSNIISLW